MTIKTQKTWTGLVTRGDPYRVSVDEGVDYGDIIIGGIDWLPDALGWITDTILSNQIKKGDRNITVAIGYEEFIGTPDAEVGWGYSEFTEVDPDKFELWVQGHFSHNILRLLALREGEFITLSMSYGSINMQELRDEAAKVAALVSRNPDLSKLRMGSLDYTKERLDYFKTNLSDSDGKPIMVSRVSRL